MSMSNRGLIKAGKRVLVVVNGRLGSAAKNGADVTMFGPAYATKADAVAYGLSKFGKVAVPYVKREPVKVEPVKPVQVVESAPVDSKPLGILPPPDTSKPKPLSELRVPELRGLCKAHGLKGYSKLAKAGLIEMLTAAKVAA